MFISQPKIFVSSTVTDLPSERRASLEAIKKLNGYPVMSEFTMEAQSADSLSACLSKVMESDIYVLVIGGRYGWQPDGKESITELEYQTAKGNNIPILVFNTTHPKDDLQKLFEAKVNPSFFRKTVQDAFELQDELEKALKAEIAKRQNEYFNRTEPIYSNLVRINFPAYIYIGEIDIDKSQVRAFNKERNRPFYNPSLWDFAISALYMNGISFPHDWIVWNGKLITFHNLHDASIGLTKIIDNGTVEQFTCDEFYNSSSDHLSQFKYLLKKCLEAKLHKLKIKWIKEDKLFAFLPVTKDDAERWRPRYIEWTKTVKKATRKVVDIKMDLRDKKSVFNIKSLAFRTGFEVLENDWYLSIKPEWVFLWNNLSVCDLAYKNIQWLKKTERNMHVFNHFNFILRYLQPPASEAMFSEYRDYPFLQIGKIEKFDFAPVIPDAVWSNLEDPSIKKQLTDSDGDVALFEV